MSDGKSMKMSDHKGMKIPSDKTAASGMTMDHGATVWPHFANMILGVWLITNVFALGYRSGSLQVSDVISGVLVIVLAILSVLGTAWLKFWSPWTNSLVGLWLSFAPLVFWAPTSAVYSNDTLIGALVVVFAILAPGMPMAKGMSMEPGPDVPLGWSYNPSSWPQRAPIIALALVGFFLSRQMAAFELGQVATLADPFFGFGTQTVLTSDVVWLKPSKIRPCKSSGPIFHGVTSNTGTETSPTAVEARK